MHDDYDIKVGDKVRSYDFPFLKGEQRELCYVEGIVTGILVKDKKYLIKVSRQVFAGAEVEVTEAEAMPPINGIATIFGGITDGVVKIY